MARLTLIDIIGGRPSLLLLLTIVATCITPNCAFSLESRDSDTCPSSYNKCGSSKLPDNFCCSSSSTCVSLDDSSSAICCPSGQDCSYIAPITCDVQLQNATLYPKNVVKTTRLDEELPKCGDSCCPFGYTCQGDNTCALVKDSSATATSSISSSTPTFATSTKASSSETSNTSSASQASSTADASSTGTDAQPLSTISVTTPSSSSSSSPHSGISSLSANSVENSDSNSNSNNTTVTGNCPSFPSAAVAAGFFPGAVFGAMAILLSIFCLRRRQQKRDLPPSVKVFNHTKRSSNGTLIGISEPIPSDETSFRTDFLLQNNQKRTSDGARSMLQRTGTRVKSLFGATPKLSSRNSAKPPPLPITIAPRQPSTESIKVYTPPGVFATSGFLKPAPDPVDRPDTTFTEMMDRVGFKNNNGDPCYRVTDQDNKSGLRVQQNA
ncbi:hypothetical protein ASPWEDRAFT_112093 [Aspergillus wentii DTO 134E9]|uniref:Mid2 domain-containing protein n=1 Tax=Aspergillus wentii DTO 134E9 TaxID=1073089 RepID=A0A1L9RL45_ASPWE|nr:uncharacterized protein ASPWEDRAFT_112093 [Aspergillus wentii DTO 134E9]KAI9924595.1 hypothetical protein MW887_006868 [Aspergillus wentii]OJJ35641.1 hypothetical protein ASPWEDRAFT_112093 [Aspergillus wentii DTO 134E9]